MSATTNLPAAPRTTASVWSRIISTVTESVEAWPCITIAALSPTSIPSTALPDEQTGERVVVTRHHRKLAAFGFRAKKIWLHMAHLRRKASRWRAGCGEEEIVVQHRLGTCQKSIKSRTYMRPVEERHGSTVAALGQR